jgi:serine/threonine protein kinase
MHPPIATHRNIVDLLAIGWEAGNSDTSPEIEWPVLVMPFATYGTLDIYQQDNDVPETTIISLCLDVARGLEVLHTCGIVHGDLKSENVLIFHDDVGLVAKLCDFGCSIVGGQETMKLRGGSQPWNCPEWKSEMRKEALPLTDVYSFGLLFWRSLSKARNPFQDLRSFAELLNFNLKDIERLKEKRDDQLLKEIIESLELSDQDPSIRAKLIQSILHHTVLFEPQRRSLGQCLEDLGKLTAHSLKIKSRFVKDDFQL